MNRKTGFSLVVRHLIVVRATVEFDGFDVPICEVWQECEGSLLDQLHHRRPRQRGGSRLADTNMPSNSLAACGPCHSWIESNRDAAYVNGWLVRQGQVPADIRVLRRGEWVVLDDLGGVTPVAAEDIPGIERGFDLVKLDNKNGPGPSASTPGEFPDLTTMEVASDR